ncbi:uncharacterized protein RJT20DRAFT_14953 [Scheffersomyces xylosifermentans]|uniref:uncharacterized protein n=1 Tax=Scheffersomyces xylosifermentans TaxID=1304137 RepID=UPI00315D5B78
MEVLGFKIRKFSEFNEPEWLHYPQRSHLSIHFVQSAQNEYSVDITILWKGATLRTINFDTSDDTVSSIVAKFPSIGFKQSTSMGVILSRFQISFNDREEYERCYNHISLNLSPSVSNKDDHTASQGQFFCDSRASFYFAPDSQFSAGHEIGRQYHNPPNDSFQRPTYQEVLHYTSQTQYQSYSQNGPLDSKQVIRNTTHFNFSQPRRYSLQVPATPQSAVYPSQPYAYPKVSEEVLSSQISSTRNDEPAVNEVLSQFVNQPQKRRASSFVSKVEHKKPKITSEQNHETYKMLCKKSSKQIGKHIIDLLKSDDFVKLVKKIDQILEED